MRAGELLAGRVDDAAVTRGLVCGLVGAASRGRADGVPLDFVEEGCGGVEPSSTVPPLRDRALWDDAWSVLSVAASSADVALAGVALDVALALAGVTLDVALAGVALDVALADAAALDACDFSVLCMPSSSRRNEAMSGKRASASHATARCTAAFRGVVAGVVPGAGLIRGK